MCLKYELNIKFVRLNENYAFKHNKNLSFSGQ